MTVETTTESKIPQQELYRLTDAIVVALKSVYDPEIPVDIYELGLIYKVDVDETSRDVSVEMTLTALDALRIFDLIYVLTPGKETTISMSVFARQQLFDFDNFAYGSAASTLLFLIIGLITIMTIRLGKMRLGD